MTRYEKNNNHLLSWGVIVILLLLISSSCCRIYWLFGCLIPNVNHSALCGIYYWSQWQFFFYLRQRNSKKCKCDDSCITTDRPRGPSVSAPRSPLRFCFATNDSELHLYCVFHFGPSTPEHTQICWHGLNRQLRIKGNSLLRTIICKISTASFVPW